MSEFHNILHNNNNNNNKLTEEKLIAYLEGKLSPEEQHAVETWLAEEGIEADALEGLMTLSPAETKHMTNHINHVLQQRLHKKSRRRHKYIKNNNWAWIAVIIILTLCIIAYIVLHYSSIHHKS